MGRDNQPKARQLRRREAKASLRASHARVLIVTEGSKTEPMYLEEIRGAFRLHSANVEVQHCQWGTAPLQVVQYARQLFEKGDLVKRIRPQSFDQVFAVFDRDDHDSYFDALALARSLDGKLRNDEKQAVGFKAVASIPSFELWLLLHFEDVLAPIHRDAVMQRLKQHLPGYEKGAGGAFAATRHRLAEATQRAQGLSMAHTPYSDPEPFTDLHTLVSLLTSLRD